MIIVKDRPKTVADIESEKRLYRGEWCPIVKFNSGPFRHRIYVRYKGHLVHVGDRKLTLVTKTAPVYAGKSQEEFHKKEDTNGSSSAGK